MRYINTEKQGVRIGSLRNRLKFSLRKIKADNDSIDYSENFTNEKIIYGYLEATNGEELWDGSNLTSAYTHICWIRYLDKLVYADFVEYGDDKYKIVDCTRKSDFLKFRLLKKGDKSKERNYV